MNVLHQRKENGTLAPKKCFIVTGLLVVSVAAFLLFSHGNGMNAVKKRQAEQRLSEPYVTIMGSDALNKGYNLLRGQGAEPGVSRAIGQFSTNDKKYVEYDGTVYFQPDQIDITMNAKCWSSQTLSEVTSAHSASEARNISSQFSFGLKTKVEGGFRIFGKGGNAGVEAAAVYGNSREMRTSARREKQSFSHSTNSFVESSLFQMFVDWNARAEFSKSQFQFYEAFTAEIQEFNKGDGTSTRANTKRVMEFVERFGTHVIREAIFGAKCAATTYLESGSSKAQMDAFSTSAQNYGLSMKAWASVKKFGGSVSGSFEADAAVAYQEETFQSGTYEGEFKYSIDNIRCSGNVKDNLCNKEFSASADDPDMISYVTYPIWEVGTAPWTDQGRQQFLVGLKDYEKGAADCRAGLCNGRGTCVLTGEFWQRVSLGEFDGDFSFNRDFDPQCVCDDGWVSDDCNAVQPALPDEAPIQNTWFWADHDMVKQVSFGCSLPCGVRGAAPVLSNRETESGQPREVCSSINFVGFTFPWDTHNRAACVGTSEGVRRVHFNFYCLCERRQGIWIGTGPQGKPCPAVCAAGNRLSVIHERTGDLPSVSVCRPKASHQQAGWNQANICAYQIAHEGRESETPDYECLCY